MVALRDDPTVRPAAAARVPAGRRRRLPLSGSIDPEARARVPAPRAEPADQPGDRAPGRVEVLTFDTERAEAEHLADLLRRAHLEDGVAWSDMAVLVRSGRTSIPALRRALAAAGVPVEVASDDTPLVQEPAVRSLVDALRAVVNLDQRRPAVGRATSTRSAPTALLPVAARRPRRHRRPGPGPGAPAPRQGPGGGRGDASPGPRPSCSARPLLDPDAVRRAGGRRHRASQRRPPWPACSRTPAASSTPASRPRRCCGTLWAGTAWPRTAARRRSRAAGPAARHAHRDLDAICALFEAAASAEEQRGHTSRRDLPRHPRRAADPRRHPGRAGASAASAVRLLTAHRAKGLEWRLVVVAHVQEEGWPDLRRRATLLQADRIGTDGLVPPTTVRELLADERRLFYVACTRARQRLVVTAVASTDDDGEQPSRFLEELGRPASSTGRADRPGRCRWPGWSPSCAAPSPTTASPSPAPRGCRAGSRELAAEHRAGERWVPAADPASWWGTRAVSDEPTSRSGPGRAGSALGERPDQPCAVPGQVVPGARGRRCASVHPGAGLRQRRPRPR